MKKYKLKNRLFYALFKAKWYIVSSAILSLKFEAFLSHLAAFLSAILILLGIYGCGTTKVVTVEGKDFQKIEIKDSIVYRDSIVYITQERIVEIVPQLDTLTLEIEQAKSTTYLDTTLRVLRGKLESKKKPQIQYIERIEYKEKVDTVYIQQPQPYPVEVYKVPKWSWYTLIFSALVLLWTAIRIYLKIKL